MEPLYISRKTNIIPPYPSEVNPTSIDPFYVARSLKNTYLKNSDSIDLSRLESTSSDSEEQSRVESSRTLFEVESWLDFLSRGNTTRYQYERNQCCVRALRACKSSWTPWTWNHSLASGPKSEYWLTTGTLKNIDETAYNKKARTPVNDPVPSRTGYFCIFRWRPSKRSRCTPRAAGSLPYSQKWNQGHPRAPRPSASIRFQSGKKNNHTPLQGTKFAPSKICKQRTFEEGKWKCGKKTRVSL